MKSKLIFLLLITIFSTTIFAWGAGDDGQELGKVIGNKRRNPEVTSEQTERSDEEQELGGVSKNEGKKLKTGGSCNDTKKDDQQLMDGVLIWGEQGRHIPQETSKRILSYLLPKEFHNVRLVSKAHRKFIDEITKKVKIKPSISEEEFTLCISSLISMPHLTHLNLKDCRFTTDGLKHLSSLANLTSLNLERDEHPFTNTDECIAPLSVLTNLTSLNLWYWDGLANRLEHLFPLAPKLIRLDVGCMGIEDQDVLDISTNLTNLTALGLSSHNLTDESIPYLLNLTRLRKLDFFGCRELTYDGLSKLSQLSSLTCVDLHGCDGISNEDTSKLISEDFENTNITIEDENYSLPSYDHESFLFSDDSDG